MESRCIEVAIRTILVERVLLFILGRWQLAEQSSRVESQTGSRRCRYVAEGVGCIIESFSTVRKEKKTAVGERFTYWDCNAHCRRAPYELELAKAARADPLQGCYTLFENWYFFFFHSPVRRGNSRAAIFLLLPFHKTTCTQHAYTPVDILRLLLELEFTFLSCTHFSLRCCVCVYSLLLLLFPLLWKGDDATEASYSLTAACWANIFIHKERTMSAVCCCYIVHYAVLLSYPSTLCASSSFFLCLNNGSLYLFTRLLFF